MRAQRPLQRSVRPAVAIMASLLLLRQGRVGAVKTMLLEARVFRGFASTVPLSVESGKSEKGLPPNSKKQSPPKNVVAPKERGRLLATQAAAELSKNLPSSNSYPSVVNKGGMGASPNPDDSMLLTQEGLPEVLSRKTLVEFPQKVPSPFRKQGSASKARQKVQKVTDDSSSSSSSDSESDKEGDSSEVGPRVASKSKRGFRKTEASHALENISAKEKPRSQKPHTDATYPEPRQPKKKGATPQLSEDRKDAKPETLIPRPQVNEELLKQDTEEKQLHKVFRSNETEEESQKPRGVTGVLTDHTESALSSQLDSGPAPTLLTEEARVEGQLQATPGARQSHLEKPVPELNGKATSSLLRNEHPRNQGIGGPAEAAEDILEDQAPITDLKTVPAENTDVFSEQAAVLKPQSEAVEDSAPPVEDQDGTQEPAWEPPEPSDSTTYKNLQHHDYTTYTFLDLNLDLSKFRMPQPSSGRTSPRH
ncbi:NADH dehydrogenase [ubiquinone] flavoprotein 3, mitochondrial isoform X2 [Nycticebus coucang]|uniref:NADH dehydrogenase [ubiquinone] flavoprotein 3, mitochondrial isoform X2 n=1 Tax=Nycticebus coucang TaxID=9470 RepID=UPI00234CC1E0|nr:NADH dehydrogenase [ubiquinone] flavoprotein 3, mitochondrial isoform X2 [Nycticebus coucang]